MSPQIVEAARPLPAADLAQTKEGVVITSASRDLLDVKGPFTTKAEARKALVAEAKNQGHRGVMITAVPS